MQILKTAQKIVANKYKDSKTNPRIANLNLDGEGVYGEVGHPIIKSIILEKRKICKL